MMNSTVVVGVTIGIAILYALIVRPTKEDQVELNHPVDFYQKQPWYFEEEEKEEKVTTSSLAGKIAVITGSSTGIGRALAKELFLRGATVIVTSRKLARAEAAVADMEQDAATTSSDTVVGRFQPMALDCSDLSDVTRFATEVLNRYNHTIDYFSMNAGIQGLFMDPMVSKDGYDYTYATNYLGHLLLLQRFLPALKQQAEATGHVAIVATSSMVHWLHSDNLTSLLPTNQMKPVSGIVNIAEQYGNTKLLQILMCFELQRQLLKKEGNPDLIDKISVTPVIPGLIGTAIMDPSENGKDIPTPLSLPPRLGAWTSLHAMLSKNHRGKQATDVVLQPYYSPPLDTTRGPTNRMYGALRILVFEGLLQKVTWGLHRWTPHFDSYNREFGARLWKESMTAVQPWL